MMEDNTASSNTSTPMQKIKNVVIKEEEGVASCKKSLYGLPKHLRNDRISGVISWRSPIQLEQNEHGMNCFKQVYYMIDHLARHMNKPEYAFRLVLYGKSIKNIQLKEGHA